MPVIKTPLPDYTEFKKLKQRDRVAALRRRVELYETQKAIAVELDELNLELFGTLTDAVPDGVKSIAFEDHRISFYVGDPRRTFDRSALVKHPYRCPHCRKSVTTPAKVVDECYKTGKQPKPTVSVSAIKSGGDGDDNGEGE